MKKLRLWIFMLITSSLQAQFVDFKDNTSSNRFLGLDIEMCATTTNNSKKDYQKAYDCKNNTISTLLNRNFLGPELLGQQLYIFNDFIYWMSNHDGMSKWNGKEARVAKKQAKANADPENNFSGSGVFMIVIGTSSYLQQIVASDKICPEGQTLLVAQLKYNDGNSLVTWSQDSICLSPADTFEIVVSKEQDNTVLPGLPKADIDGQGVNWMKDNGPAAHYAKAGGSPRKIRLVRKSSGASDAPVVSAPEPSVKKIATAKKSTPIAPVAR
ncbi:MAG: hypothetical protein Q8Q60_02250 [Candidatus Chromulinivorax sp.]|nr:hypothetical protein [Candidatus Chromulinivorax sp.]